MQVHSHHMQDFAQDGIFPNNDFCMCDYLVLRIRLRHHMQDFLHKVHFFLIWVVSFRCALFTRALG